MVKCREVSPSDEVINLFGDYWVDNLVDIFGFYDNDELQAVSGISNDFLGLKYYHLCVCGKPSISLAKSLNIVLKQYLEKYKTIYAVISHDNTKSLKMASQFGFNDLTKTQYNVTKVLSIDNWRYASRWKNE